ncbi:MAG TPA: hypothetical protein VGC54_09420 [Planctomycetota bacterium]
MIEPSPTPPPAGPDPESLRQEGGADPVVLEDLTAVLRLPGLFRKLDKVLAAVTESFQLPEDSPFRPHGDGPGDGVHEYGFYWRDPDQLLQLFAGLSWGEAGHDPLWEVRIEALAALDPEQLRAGGLHRIAARRAEGRFSEWDSFWHEDKTRTSYLIGASAAATRFLEEENPDATAAEYLSGAVYALSASGSLGALLEAARHVAGLGS